MKPKKDNSVVHGVDCKKLGNRYASALLFNSGTQLADMPELKKHCVYRSLKPEEQYVVRSNIRFITQDLLIQTGLAPETVARVLDDE